MRSIIALEKSSQSNEIDHLRITKMIIDVFTIIPRRRTILIKKEENDTDDGESIEYIGKKTRIIY